MNLPMNNAYGWRELPVLSGTTAVFTALYGGHAVYQLPDHRAVVI